MKKIFIFLIILSWFGYFSAGCRAQNNLGLPSVILYNMNHERVDASSLTGGGKPMLVVIWSFTDRRSCDNLAELYQVLNDSSLAREVRMIAIFSDVPGRKELVKPYVSGNEIGCEVFFDTNGDFIRSLGVKPPHTLLYDTNMKLHCQQSGYCSGNQSLLCKELNHCLQQIE